MEGILKIRKGNIEIMGIKSNYVHLGSMNSKKSDNTILALQWFNSIENLHLISFYPNTARAFMFPFNVLTRLSWSEQV